MRYSESTGCFYPEWCNYGSSLPSDAIEVPEEDFHKVINKSSNSNVQLVSGRIVIEEENQQEAKERQLTEALSAIDLEVQEADKQPFTYNGNLYYPDTEFIQGIFSVLPLLPDNYTETWKTAEKEGIKNKKVVLDKAGITGLALAYLQFKKTNWAVGEAKKEALKDAFLEGV